MGAGRFAPSPTGSLHVGNLRTALVGWLVARTTGRRHLVRIEDLDAAASRDELVAEHLRDLAALGIDWDEPPVRQSERHDRHEAALARLADAGLLYPCYCSRREVAEAATAPHGPGGRAYPGTCRELTVAERARRADERPAAMRLRADGIEAAVTDVWSGDVRIDLDDFVVRRNDGTPAYNLAVVVDDADQGVDQVVRGIDLLDTTPRQVHLAELLGLAVPEYRHVGLAVGRDGERLAKRHGSVTLDDLVADGWTAADVVTLLARSLGILDDGEAVTDAADLLDRFDPDSGPTDPWVYGDG